MRNQALQPKLFLGGSCIWHHFVCTNARKNVQKRTRFFGGGVQQLDTNWRLHPILFQNSLAHSFGKTTLLFRISIIIPILCVSFSLYDPIHIHKEILMCHKALIEYFVFRKSECIKKFLLTDGNVPAFVASWLRFSSLLYFRFIFKKITGVLLKEYKCP